MPVKRPSRRGQYRYSASPLQRTLDRLIRILTATTVVLCALYVLLYFLHDMPEKELVRMIAATVTLLVPQGLILMASVALVLGAVRLSTRVPWFSSSVPSRRWRRSACSAWTRPER